MSQAKRLASNIIFINKGKVIEENSSKEFFIKPKSVEAKKYINGEILF